jgi:hypothetical protein
MMQTAKPVQLKPQTLESFAAYIQKAELEMEETLRGQGSFLWSDLNPDRVDKLREGHVVAQFWLAKGRSRCPMV